MSYPSLLQAIGTTPLVRIPFNSPATILAKLEYLNPGGSVKDRSALYMIEKAEREGRLKPGGTIIDASSGNHGIALAMIGAVKGYKVIVTVSEKISKEKLQCLRAYGAEVVMCPATKFIDDQQSYHYVAKKIAANMVNSFMPNQYYNEENREAHYRSLGPEVWKQTEGKVTHFFAGAGTGGTVSGVGQFLKEQNPQVQVFGIDSTNSLRSTKGNPKPYLVEGIGIDFNSRVLNENVIDKIIPISDQEALQELKLLGKQYGLLLGPSSGAVFAGMRLYQEQFAAGDIVVIIFSDSGRAYLSKNFYDQPSGTPYLSSESVNISPQAEFDSQPTKD